MASIAENCRWNLTRPTEIWQNRWLLGDSMNVDKRIRSRARASLLACLGVIALSACSTLEAQEDGAEFSVEDSKHSQGSEEPSEDEPGTQDGASKEESSKAKTKEPTPKATPEGSEESPKDPQERSCDDIVWGEELREGETVTLGATRGYLDADGDNKVEEKETDVGMCQLHQTGKKCGMVFYARRT